jgi:putative transport protein
MDPFVLMFFTVAVGLLMGKVKIGKLQIGALGNLFTGLILGWFVYEYCTKIVSKGESATGYVEASKAISEGIVHSYFFNLALIFFVAAVGLLAAKDMRIVLKKYGIKFIALGILITFVGAASTYGATILLEGTNSYEVAGVYTGALTSSPGLGAALESSKAQATLYAKNFEHQNERVQKEILQMIDPSGALTLQNTTALSKEQQSLYVRNAEASVGIGHAIGYPFGVIVVILAINFISVIFKMDIDTEKRKYLLEMSDARKAIGENNTQESPFSLLAFGLTCFIGYLFGSIEINLGPLGYFSLGATGGILIIGLVLGYFGKIGPLSFRMDPKVLTLIREIGLAFFLAVVGLKYGFKAFDSLIGSGISLALVSLAVSLLSILVGFVVGRYLFKLNWILLSGAICGGMTSTPGLGAAIDALKSDDPAAGYGAAYPFALLGMILFTIILHKVPVL